MDKFRQDIRFGLRMLLRSPGFTFIAIAALAIGIGANTAIFSVVNGVLLRALPYSNPDELAMVWVDNRRQGIREDITSWPNFVDWRDQNNTFQAMSGYSSYRTNLTGDGEPEQLLATQVTTNFFALMSVTPIHGRAFTPDEEQPGKENVAVLSYSLWQRRYGGDQSILNKSILLNGTKILVVGVAPKGFEFPDKVDLWTPLAPNERARAARGSFWLPVIGRLKPGVRPEQAQADMDVIASRLEQQYPNNNSGYGINVVPLYEQTVGNVRRALLVLLGAVGFVLLIACANVANLMLARATSRYREIAVRAALGAGRGRIILQLLTESILLSAVASALGVLLAFWGINGLLRIAPDNLPRLGNVGIDARVLAFTAGLAVLTAIVFGLVPALQASRLDLNEALKEGGRTDTAGGRAKLVRNGFVVLEIALAIVLLVGAGLLIRSFANLKRVDPGFRTDRLLTAQLRLPRTKYPEGPQVAVFYQQVLDRLRALPDVEGATATSGILLPKLANSGTFSIEGKPQPNDDQRLELPFDAVVPDYFQLMGIELLRGRAFNEHDTASSLRVVIINDTMVRRYFPNEDPIGRRLTFGDPDDNASWMTIVGVVKDTKRQGLSSPVRIESFMPHTQMPARAMELVVRTRNEPQALVKSFREAIWAIDRDLPIPKVQTIDDIFAGAIAEQRLNTMLLGMFAGVALLLAAVGIYGVMSYATSQRMHEMGIRVALGASKRDILKLVVGQGMLLALAGVVAGVIASLLLARVLRTLLFGISATDLVTFATTPAILIVVALVACYLPARRATRVDPISTLRYE